MSSTQAPAQVIPDGFRPIRSRGAFTDQLGPIYARATADGDQVFGFVPDTGHCNLLGFVHGGVLATLLDSAMAHAVSARFGCMVVTTRLEVAYLAPVPAGRWIEVQPHKDGVEADTVSMGARLVCRRAAAATAVARFQLLRNRPLPRARK